VGLKWISENLMMGHPGSVSRLIGGIPKNSKLAKKLGKLGKILKCEDSNDDFPHLRVNESYPIDPANGPSGQIFGSNRPKSQYLS